MKKGGGANWIENQGENLYKMPLNLTHFDEKIYHL